MHSSEKLHCGNIVNLPYCGLEFPDTQSKSFMLSLTMYYGILFDMPYCVKLFASVG